MAFCSGTAHRETEGRPAHICAGTACGATECCRHRFGHHIIPCTASAPTQPPRALLSVATLGTVILALRAISSELQPLRVSSSVREPLRHCAVHGRARCCTVDRLMEQHGRVGTVPYRSVLRALEVVLRGALRDGPHSPATGPAATILTTRTRTTEARSARRTLRRPLRGRSSGMSSGNRRRRRRRAPGPLPKARRKIRRRSWLLTARSPTMRRTRALPPDLCDIRASVPVFRTRCALRAALRPRLASLRLSHGSPLYCAWDVPSGRVPW